MRKWFKNKVNSSKFSSVKSSYIAQLMMRYDYLFHFTRPNCLKGIVIGLFWAMQPIPFQMVPAVLCAYILRANLPLALICVWISNPITMAPMMFFNYFVGTKVLGMPVIDFTFNIFHYSGWWDMAKLVWLPLLVGSLIVGTVSGIIGYIGTNGVWHYYVMRDYKTRQKRKKVKNK